MLRRLKRSGKAGFAGTLSEHHDYLLNLISVQSTGRTRSSSLVTLARPPVSFSLGLQITNPLLAHMLHHLTCGISSLLHYVNLILFTLLLVHLILRISPHLSHHLRSHHLLLPRPFSQDLKLISFKNPFLHSHSFPSRLTSRILTCTELKKHCCVCFSFWLHVLD